MSKLHDLFRATGRRHPAELTETDLLAWCQAARANNSIRQRASSAATFLRWCQRSGIIADNPGEALRGPDSPIRRVQRTYGKVQAANRGRWLTREEAFGRLVAVCSDGTVTGLRDEIGLRLGLTGMRLSEIVSLRVGDLHLDDADPTITWTGKGRKPRRIVPGPGLVEALRRWLDAYAGDLDRPPRPEDPVLCRGRFGPAPARRPSSPICWTQPMSDSGFAVMLRRRSAQAGLGHVAPHDLRRTAAGLLHRSVDEHGAHHFDLLDIQKVLGHSDPATTMRSYLDPLDTEVIGRAASVLDG